MTNPFRKTNIVNIFAILLMICSYFPFNAYSADKIIVATIDRPPFSYHDEKNVLTGFSVELWEKIAAKNALAIANISVTSGREKIADFSQPIIQSGMVIAVKKGSNNSIFRLIWESGIILFLLGAFSYFASDCSYRLVF